MFKVGDKIKCISKKNPSSSLVLFRIYTVKFINPNGTLFLEELHGRWTPHQFIPISRSRKGYAKFIHEKAPLTHAS